MRIWSLAVAVDEPITPVQLRAKSNKFVWSEQQIGEGGVRGEKTVAAVQPLAAVQLSLVCHATNSQVATAHVSITLTFCAMQDRLINVLTAILQGQSLQF